MNIMVSILISVITVTLTVNTLSMPETVEDYCNKYFQEKDVERCLNAEQPWYDDAKQVALTMGIGITVVVWSLFIIGHLTQQQPIRKDALGIKYGSESK